jgi:RimJ/RimL family protein N-acetyltransferase
MNSRPDPSLIAFRSLTMNDLPLMHRWLNTGFVKQWYNEPWSYEEVVAHYGPRVLEQDATYPFIILYGETPIGYVQTYRIADTPEYAAAVQVDEDAAGIDLFIGDESYIHRGLGSHILTRFMQHHVWRLTGATVCIIGPEPKNAVAIRAYEKAGFRYLKTVQVPDEPQPEYLMWMNRPAD